MTDTAIGNRLGISEATVKSYWGRVRAKLGPFNRTELVAHALTEASERAIVELNSELNQLRSALATAQSEPMVLQKAMLENAPDAVFAVDQSGCFVWMNLEAERMFGYRFDELAGEPVTTLVPIDLHAKHRTHMTQYFANPERKQMGEHLATIAVRKSGEEFSIAATLATIETHNGRIVTCFIREVRESVALADYASRHGAANPLT